MRCRGAQHDDDDNDERLARRKRCVMGIVSNLPNAFLLLHLVLLRFRRPRKQKEKKDYLRYCVNTFFAHMIG